MLKALKELFHEAISTRIVFAFADWLMDIGYKEEGETISITCQSWIQKRIKQLKTETKADRRRQRNG